MTGPAFGEAIAAVVADLVGAGIKATAESASVRLPGVWVGGVRATPITYDGAWDYDLDLYLVDQVAGDMRGYASLDELAKGIAAMWPLTDGRQLEVTSVALPGMPAVPAYRYPITITH